MKLFVITLHDTVTEEIVGMVAPLNPQKTYPDEFQEVIRESFIDFHKSPDYNGGEYILEDFVYFHNKKPNSLKIQSVYNDFIQLSEESLM
jgi:hypothetical protein